MVNFGLNSASILGIFLAVAGAGLYFLRSVRPELSRDHDIFFAAVGLLCGLILLFQGWRLDPILQFGQFLLTGAAIFFAVETIRLRGATTEQARRNSPIVDNERRVSKTRVYTEAELDQIEPYEEEQEEGYRNNRRLRGYEEPRSTRRSNYSQEEPRSPKSRRPGDSSGDSEPPRKRPSRPGGSRPESYDAWEESSDMWEERPKTRRPSRPRPEGQPPETSQRPLRKRPTRPPGDQERYPTRSSQSTPADYVDYQPIDPPVADQGTRPPSDEDLRGDRPDDSSNPNRFDY